MASNAKKKTTMAKLNRERRLRERRAEKQAKKEAKKQASTAEFGSPGETTLFGESAELASGEDAPASDEDAAESGEDGSSGA